MARLDTALTGKGGKLFGHQHITYTIGDEPECEPGKVWDEELQQCVTPKCQPGDPGYSCGCQCDEGQECVAGQCVSTEAPCGECYKLVNGECVRDNVACPQSTPSSGGGGGTPICGECYTYNRATGECEFDSTKCPQPEEKCNGDEGWYYDEISGKCKKDDNVGEPEIGDCYSIVNVGSGVVVNSDGKITGAPGNTRQNGARYWFNTACYNSVELFARVTKEGEGANKSGIEYGYAETKGSLAYTTTGYYGDYVEMHHEDVLKIILYKTGKIEVYIKGFIRPGVWTGWKLYDGMLKPELPPSGNINWMMFGVMGGAEIWGMKYNESSNNDIISEDDAVVEDTPWYTASELPYTRKRAWGTVKDKDGNEGYTMWFGSSCGDTRWANGETKRNNCTYKNGILTVPKNTSGGNTFFKYVGCGLLPIPDAPSSYMIKQSSLIDVKFKLEGGRWGSGTVKFRYGKITEYSNELYMPIEKSLSLDNYYDHYRLVTEAYYSGGSVDCYSYLYGYTGDGDYNGYVEYARWWGVFQLSYWWSGAQPGIEIELDSSSNAEKIIIPYLAEGYS